MEQSLEMLENMRIGETVETDGVRLQCRKVINDNGCADCHFDENPVPMPLYPEQCAVMRYCMSVKRSDRTSVKFVEIGR